MAEPHIWAMWVSLLGWGKSNTTQTVLYIGQCPVMVKLTTWEALQKPQGMSPEKSRAIAIHELLRCQTANSFHEDI